ncbi:hypothetical protein LEP1GSC059_3444 [Leptospira noguchii serovar Panama str. CZ214]|uniref:Uncharacterized protein n=1 Tax=Leptospira noguchii serovar Panama str. CZ214 TaxID=1001595 RepID=T0FMS2_9LEPT|nr:hypothetical protein LEP1GSC059_3444 [Leptospira noguchii serovar Panama str. CZ214]
MTALNASSMSHFILNWIQVIGFESAFKVMVSFFLKQR